VNAMGSGLRLLPMMAGLAAGAGPADIVAKGIGAKLTVALGFAILAAGLLAGPTMSASSGDAFIAGWTAVSGLGFGLALATAASAALSGLREDRAGVGSAVMQAVQKAGAPLAAAILGSMLNAGYTSRLNLTGLPAAAAGAVRSSAFAGLAVARKLASARLPPPRGGTAERLVAQRRRRCRCHAGPARFCPVPAQGGTRGVLPPGRSSADGAGLLRFLRPGPGRTCGIPVGKKRAPSRQIVDLECLGSACGWLPGSSAGAARGRV
jgi:hypothetical protein